MFRSLRLGSAFGIPLFLHPTFFLLPLYALVVSLGQPWPNVLLSQAGLFTVFGCVLLHELGHALMARAFGIGTRDITMFPIGGVARLESTGASPAEEIAIALAGPAVNLVIGLLLAPLAVIAMTSGFVTGESLTADASLLTFAGHYVTLVCFGNVALLVFNLLPAFPMDGGRVLRALLSLVMRRLRATEIAAGLGLVAALGLVALGILARLPGLVLVALFVGFAGQMELLALRRSERPHTVEVVFEPIILEPRPVTDLVWDSKQGMWVRWLEVSTPERGKMGPAQ